MLTAHECGLFDGHYICACPASINEHGERLLSLVDSTMLPPLTWPPSDGGVSAPVWRAQRQPFHAAHRDLGTLPGVGHALIEYIPGESSSGLFGGNANWRGPIWMPTNYMLVQALAEVSSLPGRRVHGGGALLGNRALTLKEIATLIARRASWTSSAATRLLA